MNDSLLPASIWAGVVGQRRAVERLRSSAAQPVHAYLFVGPPGSTKEAAARAFAAQILAGPVDDASQRDARLVLSGDHPDVREITRVGASLSAEQIDDIVRSASLAPVEGVRKVLILDEFHLLSAQGAARLLKTLEEPPPSTVFVVLADQIPPDLVTIASRCVKVEFGPIDSVTIEARLIAEGHPTDRARTAAVAANGNLDRARVLASDDDLVRRRDAFHSIPTRLDGNGNTVALLIDELTKLVEASAASYEPVHSAELAALEERVAASGERGSGRKTLEERHKRELRRHRMDELRSGLGVMAGTYRDALVAGDQPRPEAMVRAVARIHEALEALERNPNEVLLLQSLLLDLPAVQSP